MASNSEGLLVDGQRAFRQQLRRLQTVNILVQQRHVTEDHGSLGVIGTVNLLGELQGLAGGPAQDVFVSFANSFWPVLFQFVAIGLAGLVAFVLLALVGMMVMVSGTSSLK